MGKDQPVERGLAYGVDVAAVGVEILKDVRGYSAETFTRTVDVHIEGEIDPEVQARMEAHFKECAHCTAVLDGMNNVIRLVGDGRAFAVPGEFSKRMYSKLERYWAQGGSRKPE